MQSRNKYNLNFEAKTELLRGNSWACSHLRCQEQRVDQELGLVQRLSPFYFHCLHYCLSLRAWDTVVVVEMMCSRRKEVQVTFANLMQVSRVWEDQGEVLDST